MRTRKTIAFLSALLAFLSIGWAALDATPCLTDCSRESNRCASRCHSGEQGRGCRTSCAAADCECRQRCEGE